MVEAHTFDAIVTDMNMGRGDDGLMLLQYLNRRNLYPPTLLHSSEDHFSLRNGNGHERVAISEVIKYFKRFARFTPKPRNSEDFSHIDEFLASIDTKK